MAENTALAKLKKLDEEAARIAAEREALQAEVMEAAYERAKEAVADLNSLGGNYKLLKADVPPVAGAQRRTRRTGMRDDVLAAIKSAGSNGATRADLLQSLNVKGDKSGEQSVSNALSALKKAGQVSQKGNRYVAA